MTRSDRFQAARAQAVEAFLGVVNPETRPTFCASDEDAITGRAPGGGEADPNPLPPVVAGRSACDLLDACEDDDTTIVDYSVRFCGGQP